MIKLDISIDGLESVFEKLDLANEDITAAVERGMKNACYNTAQTAKMLCPVREGALRSSIHSSVEREGNVFVGTVYSRKKYAAYVEFGTGPRGEAEHAGTSPDAVNSLTYSPKGWVYKDAGGKFHFTNGQPARPFIYPAFISCKSKLNGYIGRALRRAHA